MNQDCRPRSAHTPSHNHLPARKTSKRPIGPHCRESAMSRTCWRRHATNTLQSMRARLASSCCSIPPCCSSCSKSATDSTIGGSKRCAQAAVSKGEGAATLESGNLSVRHQHDQLVGALGCLRSPWRSDVRVSRRSRSSEIQARADGAAIISAATFGSTREQLAPPEHFPLEPTA